MIVKEQKSQTLISQKQTFKGKFSVGIDPKEIEQLLKNLINEEIAQRNKFKFVEKKEIEKVAKWLYYPTLKSGLLLNGNVGCGKTTIARAIKNLINGLQIGFCETTIIDKKYRFALGSYPFVKNSSNICKEIKESTLARIARSREFDFENIIKSPYLFIDDLGTEYSQVTSYGSKMMPICELIDLRNDKMLFTLATTNLKIDQIRDIYGDRTMSRVKELFNILTISGGDLR